jgi:hypothetical protein
VSQPLVNLFERGFMPVLPVGPVRRYRQVPDEGGRTHERHRVLSYRQFLVTA